MDKQKVLDHQKKVQEFQKKTKEANDWLKNNLEEKKIMKKYKMPYQNFDQMLNDMAAKDPTMKKK